MSLGVLTGVIPSGAFFVAKVSRLLGIVVERPEGGDEITYRVTGQVFFASSGSFVVAIDYQDVPAKVTIDVGAAHFWDISTFGALDDIVHKLRRHDAAVEVNGLNQSSDAPI